MHMYTKVFLKWGAEIKQFERWQVMKVSINVDDLVNQIQSWEVYKTENGVVYFDILEKKKKEDGKQTHYLCHSRKEDQKLRTPENLPF